jgi:hypothetical protein
MGAAPRLALIVSMVSAAEMDAGCGNGKEQEVARAKIFHWIYCTSRSMYLQKLTGFQC